MMNNNIYKNSPIIIIKKLDYFAIIYIAQPRSQALSYGESLGTRLIYSGSPANLRSSVGTRSTATPSSVNKHTFLYCMLEDM